MISFKSNSLNYLNFFVQPSFAHSSLKGEENCFSENKLDKLIDVNTDISNRQKRQLEINELMLERQNQMGWGSGFQFWINRLGKNISVTAPVALVSGAVSGAIIPFFTKLFTGGIGF